MQLLFLEYNDRHSMKFNVVQRSKVLLHPMLHTSQRQFLNQINLKSISLYLFALIGVDL